MDFSSRLSFTEHPATVGETYAEHFQTALGFSLRMIGGGVACLVHGFFPFLFKTTGSAAIRDLYQRMIAHRSRDANLPLTAANASSQVQDNVLSGGIPRARVI